MKDEVTLLKLKREWAHDEAMKVSLQLIASLQFKIGELNSEIDELKHKTNKILNSVTIEGTKTKKEWLKDELINQFQSQLKNEKKISERLRKSLAEYQNKYFSLRNLQQVKP